MTASSDPPTPGDQRARIEAAVAACVEALELGDRDPAPQVCGGDVALLSQVRQRLAQLAAHGLIAATEPAPTAIGPYRIVRELGSGGMGQVFLASQTEPVQRDVALKIVKLGLDTREVLARFQSERQALARMSHPGIAQVFDAGITAAGRPYFVMEYVPGRMLTTYCDERRLDVASRVRLMATICRAVQHAHDRGFIHRDLKPSNILVTEHEGQPSAKIIDFGVAKAMVGGPDEATRADSLRTRAGQVLGTPEYMSPEQMALDGGDIDTRTDVYALGATLYELLCGRMPFDSQRLRRAGWREVEAILREEVPPPPSRRHAESSAQAAAAARRATSTELVRELAGEIDWIVGKAMAKARDERYPSALALAEDLERWLRHEPVAAAPPGRVYLLRKFVRRHRVAVAAGASVFASLAIGLVVSVQATADAEAARGREAAAARDMREYFDLARDAVGNLVDVANEQLQDVPQAEAPRRRMLGDALEFYAALRARRPDDDGLQRERLTALQRIAQLQRQLGQPEAALATADACMAEIRDLRRRAPVDVAVVTLAIEATAVRAAALDALGRNQEAGNALQAAVDECAQSRLDGAGAVYARLLANLAGHRLDRPEVAIGLLEDALQAIDREGQGKADARTRAAIAIDLAAALTRVDRLADAERILADAVARAERLAVDGAAAAREDQARLADRRAELLRRLGRTDEALTVQRAALALHESLAKEHPDLPAHADGVAAAWHAIARDELAASRHDAALAASEQAVATRRALCERFPSLHRLRMRLARSLLAKADVELLLWRERRIDVDVPIRTLAAVAEIADRLHAAHEDDLEVTFTYCAAHTAGGSLAAVRGDLQRARTEHTAARAAATAALARHGDSAEVRQQLAIAENNLFQANYLDNAPAEARAAAERGLEHLEAGLRLDARHGGLRDVFAALVGRVAVARLRDGDRDGGIDLLAATCRRTDRGDDAREQAALLLSQLLAGDDDGATAHGDLLRELRGVLAERIAARGGIAAAERRPAQLGGVSQPSSRLRDFDLRVAAGHVCEVLGDDDAQRSVLAEAAALAATMPGLANDRQRNLCAQTGELALRQRDATAAIDAAHTLLARVGEHGGGNYIAAGLLAGALALVDEPARQAALRDEAAACLERALADEEASPAALAQRRFAPLQGHPRFDALRAR